MAKGYRIIILSLVFLGLSRASTSAACKIAKYIENSAQTIFAEVKQVTHNLKWSNLQNSFLNLIAEKKIENIIEKMQKSEGLVLSNLAYDTITFSLESNQQSLLKLEKIEESSKLVLYNTALALTGYPQKNGQSKKSQSEKMSPGSTKKSSQNSSKTSKSSTSEDDKQLPNINIFAMVDKLAFDVGDSSSIIATFTTLMQPQLSLSPGTLQLFIDVPYTNDFLDKKISDFIRGTLEKYFTSKAKL